MITFSVNEEHYQVHSQCILQGEQEVVSTNLLHGGDSIQLKVSFLNQMIDKECVLGLRLYHGDKVVGLLADEVTIFPDVMDFDLVSRALLLPKDETVDRIDAFLQPDFDWVSKEEEFQFILGKKIGASQAAQLTPARDGFTPAAEKLSACPSAYIGDYEPCRRLFYGTICFVQDGQGLWILDGKYLAEEKVIREDNQLYIPQSTAEKLFGKETAQSDGRPGYVALRTLAQRLGACCYEDLFGLGVISDLPYDYSESMYAKRIQFMVRLLAFERPKAADLVRLFQKSGCRRPKIFCTPEEIARMLRVVNDYEDAEFLSDRLMQIADDFMKRPVQIVLDRPKKNAAFCTAIIDYDQLLPLYWAYLKTKDRKYLDRFKEHILAMAGLEHWYGENFYLMTSRALVGLAMAYDLIYDEFSEQERETMIQAMVQKGFLPALKLYYGLEDEAKWPWCIRRTNWNFICNSGVIFAACTLFDTHEQKICADVLEKAIQSLEYAMIYLAPNGELIEGLSYGAYSWNYLIFALQGLDSAFGTVFHLDSAPGEHLSYMVPFKQIGPTGVYSQGDGAYYDMNLNTGYTMWWARRLQDHGIQTMRMRQFVPGGNHTCFTDLLWFDEHAGISDWPLDYLSESTQSALSRSDWGDKAAVLGIHAGDNTFEHSHADLGTFDFEINGIRFARETGLDDDVYCVPGSIYAYETDAYLYYMSRAEGHNVYVVNPDRSAGQMRIGKSDVKILEQDDDHIIYEVDMEPAYRGQVKAAVRHVGLIERRSSLLLEDDITPLRSGDRIFWFWHSPAKIAFDDPIAVEVHDADHVVMTKDGTRLHIRFTCNVPFIMRKGISIPLETSPTRFDQLQTEGILSNVLTLVFETTEEIIHLKAKAWKE